jgi:hypothetical protein
LDRVGVRLASEEPDFDRVGVRLASEEPDFDRVGVRETGVRSRVCRGWDILR